MNWVFDGTNDEATAEAIQSKIGTEGNRSIILKPKYEVDAAAGTPYTITIVYQDEDGYLIGEEFSTISDKAAGSTYTAVAPAIENFTFGYWTNEDGSTILGYGESYFMQVVDDTKIHAVYQAAGSDPVEAVPVITLGSIEKVTAGTTHKLSCVATRDIPEGYTLVEHGMLYAKYTAELDGESFIPGAVGVKKYISNATKNKGVVRLNVKVSNDDMQVSFRGYMILKNESGEIEMFYTPEIVTGSYNGVGD